jgi:hypothetical protein
LPLGPPDRRAQLVWLNPPGPTDQRGRSPLLSRGAASPNPTPPCALVTRVAVGELIRQSPASSGGVVGRKRTTARRCTRSSASIWGSPSLPLAPNSSATHDRKDLRRCATRRRSWCCDVVVPYRGGAGHCGAAVAWPGLALPCPVCASMATMAALIGSCHL